MVIFEEFAQEICELLLVKTLFDTVLESTARAFSETEFVIDELTAQQLFFSLT